MQLKFICIMNCITNHKPLKIEVFRFLVIYPHQTNWHIQPWCCPCQETK